MSATKVSTGIFIVAAKRTPFGTFGGKLSKYTSLDLVTQAARSALAAANILPEHVDSIVAGNTLPTTPCCTGLSRYLGVRLGVPDSSVAFNVNRLCGSGFQALISAAQELQMGDADIVLAVGAENMSAAPFYTPAFRRPIPLGTPHVELCDMLSHSSLDKHAGVYMGQTAETVGARYGITRQQCDEYALSSQHRWKQANDAGLFKDEIAPMPIKTKKGEGLMEIDEHPRPETVLEGLTKLPPVFAKKGVTTAGNASGVGDGAGCVILASEAAVIKHNLTPLARLVGYSVVGCEPAEMGLGPVPAIQALTQKTSVNLQDIDIVEVNEAFAAQYLGVEKELGLDRNKTNIHGGAIAITHPIAATGARIMGHIAHSIRRDGLKYGLGSACIGGGQGIAVLLENAKKKKVPTATLR